MMRTRKHDWYDAAQHRVRYGVQVKLADGRWVDVGSQGVGVELYDTEEARDARRATLRKEPTFDPRKE